MLDGLKIYFDFLLADHLLYNSEKNQYKHLAESHDFPRVVTVNKIPAGALNKTTPTSHAPQECSTPSEVYGAEHLLRLFVRLPMFLSKAGLPLGHTQTIHTHIKDLLE